MTSKLVLAAAVFAGLVLARPAGAEDAKPADTAPAAATTTASTAASGKPVDVEADQMEVQDKEKKTIFRGHVIAKRTDVTLNSDVLAVDYTDTPQPDGTSKTEVTHIEATGNVVIVTAKEKITGDSAKMNPKSNDLEVFGNVTVAQGTTVIKGGHLHTNTSTHKMEMTGGRVKGSFLPK